MNSRTDNVWSFQRYKATSWSLQLENQNVISAYGIERLGSSCKNDFVRIRIDIAMDTKYT